MNEVLVTVVWYRVRLDALLAATKRCAASYQLCCFVNGTSGASARRPIRQGRRSLQLHPCFASSVRMARVRCSESRFYGADR